MEKCENCKHWKWTHNCWGDCSNPKIAKSPETLDENENSCVLITNIPRCKQTHFSTLDDFGCTLFEKKRRKDRKMKAKKISLITTIRKKHLAKNIEIYSCPKCEEIGLKLWMFYCPTCGVKLKWSKECKGQG